MSAVPDFCHTHDYPCWCGGTEGRVFCSQMFGRRPFVVLECRQCGTHRILPRALASQASAETLYNEYEAPGWSEGAHPQFLPSMRKRLAEVEVSFTPENNVLDVGCGDGLLLETICKEFGCTGKGIDVDQRRIATARKRSTHATFECELFDASKVDKKYDVLLCNAVVEHVIDPVNFLSELHSALVKGGSLFLLTPNANSLNYRLLRSWWRELLSIGEHIYLFTPQSLESCAGKAGFDLVASGSDFDYSTPRLQFTGLRPFLLSVWAIYKELIKRVSKQFSTRRRCDILYAHFRKRDAV